MIAGIGLSIHLLGRPRIERDGAPVEAPKSNKAWGILAYLLLAERPPARAELVTLLFAEAADPLAALRWNLNALRRLLGGGELEGDPVRLALPPGTFVDVDTLRSGTWVEAVELPGLGCDLLEGMAFPSSPAFEIWLSTERRHLGGTMEAVLREAALARLARGDARAASELSSRLVRLNPHDENFRSMHERCLAAAVNGGPPRSLIAGPVGGRAAARAQLQAGEAAISAGALDAGLECLRRAVADARAARDPELEARAMFALASALVHAARGRDEEASAALHEVLALAEEHGYADLAAGASRELGYVEFLRARYDRAMPWLRRAEELAGDDALERGRTASVIGEALSDTAHYAEALETLDEGRELSGRAGDWRQVAYQLSLAGRVHLLRGEIAAAAAALDESLELAQRESWTAFAPWPESFRGDVDLAVGDVEAASARYEHAFALSCQLGDPCWEGVASRGLGLVAARRGSSQDALEWFSESRRRCSRLPDGYVWVEAYALDAQCDVAIAHGSSAAPRWVEELARLAGRTGMRELAVRANLHRAKLGDGAALTAARVGAASIDNPALRALLDDERAAA